MDTVALLNEYESWKAEKRVVGNDTSPEAFTIDRAKQQALEALIKIKDKHEEYQEFYGHLEDMNDFYRSVGAILDDL